MIYAGLLEKAAAITDVNMTNLNGYNTIEEAKTAFNAITLPEKHHYYAILLPGLHTLILKSSTEPYYTGLVVCSCTGEGNSEDILNYCLNRISEEKARIQEKKQTLSYLNARQMLAGVRTYNGDVYLIRTTEIFFERNPEEGFTPYTSFREALVAFNEADPSGDGNVKYLVGYHEGTNSFIVKTKNPGSFTGKYITVSSFEDAIEASWHITTNKRYYISNPITK